MPKNQCDTSACNDEKPEIFYKSCFEVGTIFFSFTSSLRLHIKQKKLRLHHMNPEHICLFMVCSFFLHSLSFIVFFLVLGKQD
jgi:hypothetical protein